jgi:hypothetical protein
MKPPAVADSGPNREVWLRTNRRALALGMLLPAALALAGLALAGAFFPVESLALRIAGYLLVGVAGLALGMLAWELKRPRLAREDGCLAVYLRAGAPHRVPIDIVEGFLLGQGPSMLAGRAARRETATLVVRLAERAEDWAFREVKPALGNWCGGYITIRGTWCEPLSVALVNRLNARLGELHARLKTSGVDA